MKKSKVGSIILDILFPRRCHWCTEVVGFRHVCSCQSTLDNLELPSSALDLETEGQDARYIQQAWAGYRYSYPVSDAIVRVKFHHDPASLEYFSSILAEEFADHVSGQFDVILPVPLSKNSLKKRGYNQSALLAQSLSQALQIPIVQGVLQKTEETSCQMDLNREQRKRNVVGVYAVQLPQRVLDKRVLLVDDVITTGSTLNECAKVLLQAGAVYCGALCLASTSKGHVCEKYTGSL